MLLSLMQPVSADAMSAKNKKAHKAYVNQLKKDKKNYCSGPFAVNKKLPYVYRDLDGDKIDELITCPGYGYCTQIIYGYQNGKVKELARVGQGYFTSYYPKTKVLYVAESGNQGNYYETYYKMIDGKYQTVAEREAAYFDKKGNWRKKPVYTYYVNGKKVSKAKYERYVKTLKKGKAQDLINIKWKNY